MAQLEHLDQCADRIEAARLGLSDSYFLARAAELRRGEVNLHSLSHMRREAERLLEGLKAIDKIVAKHQGRESG